MTHDTPLTCFRCGQEQPPVYHRRREEHPGLPYHESYRRVTKELVAICMCGFESVLRSESHIKSVDPREHPND